MYMLTYPQAMTFQKINIAVYHQHKSDKIDHEILQYHLKGKCTKNTASKNNKLCPLGFSFATFFSYLSNSCLVCATIPRITNRRWTQFVDKVGSTVFHCDLFWILASVITFGEADRPIYFTICHCWFSSIQPTWPVCTTSVFWHRHCWHFCPCSSSKTIPSLK